MTGISVYIILMEIMYIFENLDKMSVPIPKFIKNVVNNVSDSLNIDDLVMLDEKAETLQKEIR